LEFLEYLSDPLFVSPSNLCIVLLDRLHSSPTMVAARLSLLAVSAAVLVSAQGPPSGPDLSSGCTSKSFSVPSWLVENISKTNEDVSFHVSNRATNFTTDVACKGGSAGAWGDCTAKTGEGLKASVKLTGSSVQFLFNQTWTCNDRSTR